MVSETFGAHLGYLAVLIGYLSFPIVAAVGAVGGFVADQSLFFIGRRFGNRLLVQFPSVAARAPRVQTLVRRWDVLAVVLVRFLYGLLVAGVGYFAGQAAQRWFGRLHHTQVLLLMAAVLAVMLVSIVIAWRRRRSPTT